AGPAGQLPGCGQPGLPDHRAAGAARHPLPHRPIHRPIQTGSFRPRTKGGLTPMKLYTLPRRAAAALLAAAVFCTATLSVFASSSSPSTTAADSEPAGSGAYAQAAQPEDAAADLEEDNGAAPDAKEEVIYDKLAAVGTVESLYA